jgi:hypothetical protein
VLLLNECLLYKRMSLSTESGNFWIHPRICRTICQLLVVFTLTEELTLRVHENRAIRKMSGLRKYEANGQIMRSTSRASSVSVANSLRAW